MRHYGTIQERRHPVEVAEGIWLWSVDYGETFFNSYVVQIDEDESVLVDPFFYTLEGDPLTSWSDFDHLPRPQAIWLTCSDHERDSHLFQKYFHIPLEVAKPEVGLMSAKADRNFKDGDILPGGWQVIELQDQKTPAECAFYQEKRQLLIVGDAILSQADGRLRRPYDEPAYTNEQKAQQGLQVLADLPIKGILVGHGDPVFNHTQEYLRDALEKDPRTIAD
jgi:glyoxylase-like metal-dependent hydrolase (beta-lactamase superfamily II)